MLDKLLIENVLQAALSTGGDFSEVFVEEKRANSISITGKEIDNANSGTDYGIGIRIFMGNKSVYSYTNDFSEKNLIETAKKAAYALSLEECENEKIVLENIKKGKNHKIILKPYEFAKNKKTDMLREMTNSALGYDSLISQAKASIIDSAQHVLIANSLGTFIEDFRTRIRFSIHAIAQKGTEMMTGYRAPGAQKGFEFMNEIDYIKEAKEAARIAVTNINAGYSPSGKMPVIIDNGFGGVIFHEACGHGLEATSVAKKTSVFADKIGQKVASEIVTAIDDGTIENGWGSSNYDDEGTKTRKNILIENGILKGYMVDRLNGRKMGMEPTGSARRQSYRYEPTSRMTNTYIQKGKSKLEDMISSTDYGLYAKKMGGGSVNPATGEFNFAVLEGYLIKNGKVTKPLRGATLVGKGPEILKKIDMVADNLELAQGMCGSVSGSIPTNVGQPAIRISEITVGGRD